MDRDRRATLVMQIMAEFMRHPGRSSKAAEAALDIALKAAAEIAEDFSWQLPLYESREANEASDDAACATCEQIAAAILALTSEGTKG